MVELTFGANNDDSAGFIALSSASNEKGPAAVSLRCFFAFFSDILLVTGMTLALQ